MKQLAISLVLVTVAAIVPILAQAEAWKNDQILLSVGGYRPSVDTRVRVDNVETGVPGTSLNLESDLSLDDRKTLVTALGHLRLAKRHALEFEYVSLSRKDEVNTQFEISYDDEVFALDTPVSATFETDVARVAYRLSFINNEQHELSVALGVHITDLKAGLNLVGDANEEFNDVTAPLPTIGGAWRYHMNERWTLQIGAEWLDIEIDDINGQLISGHAAILWFPVRNLGLGVGYHIWDLEVSATDDDLTGVVKYKYEGPKLSLNLRF